MRSQIISLIAGASIVSAQSATSAVQPAPTVKGNPLGVTYVGTVLPKAGSALAGSITGSTAPDGVGVQFKVSFSGLPTEGGPFLYHIHEKRVPEDGNCTATGAHQDPYKRGELTPCDATQPETCQTGDLSGKHGKMTTGTSFTAEYTDVYLATLMSDPAYFGDLSFVVHLANKTRIGCGNFKDVAIGNEPTPVSSGCAASSGSAMPYPSASVHYNTTLVPSVTSAVGTPLSPTSATASAPPQFTGAASKIAGGSAALLAAAAVMML